LASLSPEGKNTAKGLGFSGFSGDRFCHFF
jgi:hypothetical protein